MVTLQVRLKDEDKRTVQAAARARRISVSDYTRLRLLDAARRDLRAGEYSLSLTPAEQEAMWDILSSPVELNDAQKQLNAAANEWF